MRRRLFFLASLLSLLLCAAAVILMVIANNFPYRGSDLPMPGRGFCLFHTDDGDEYVILVPGRIQHWIRTPWDGRWYWEGNLSLVGFALATGGMGVGSILLASRFTKAECGQCPRCFYNLTGNTSGVCPECGTAVAGRTDE